MNSIDKINMRLNNILALSQLLNTINVNEASLKNIVEIGAIINELCQEAKDTFTKSWQKAEKG